MVRIVTTALLALASLTVGIVVGWQGGHTLTYDPLSEEEMFREWEKRDAAAVARLAAEIRSPSLEFRDERNLSEENGQ
jgi:hypothetical protein